MKQIEQEVLNKIKMVCSDVDGTLVDEGKSGLNPEYYEEIRRLKEKGILFAVISGRSYEASLPLFAPVSNDIIFINDNGAALHYQGKTIKSHTIEDELAKELIRDLKEELKPVTYISAMTGSYAYGPNKKFCDVLKNEFGLKLNELQQMPEDLPKDAGVMSIGVFHPVDAGKAVGEEFITKWNSHEKIQAVPGGQYWFNIIQKNVNKGVALKELMEMYGVREEEVLAIGDNMNDMEMLSLAPNSVAIGNARKEVKEICRYETAPCYEDGVLQILKRL